jgi:hypothetical protein
MAERFAFTIEERHMNTICEIECSEKYNEMLESGDTFGLLKMFNNAISILSKRIREQRCDQEFTEKEADVLALVLGLIEEE